MAFQTPVAGQGSRNRMILEQLEEQKKKLRQQSTTAQPPPPPPLPPAASGAPPPPPPPSGGSSQMALYEQQHMTPQQRTALQHAHKNSVGYFITQDSSFGNLILPVVPRFDKV